MAPSPVADIGILGGCCRSYQTRSEQLSFSFDYASNHGNQRKFSSEIESECSTLAEAEEQKESSLENRKQKGGYSRTQPSLPVVVSDFTIEKELGKLLW